MSIHSLLLARRREERQKSELLASPGVMGRQVSNIAAEFYPFSKKPRKMSKYVHKYMAYDKGAEGTAMEGFGQQLFDEYRTNLANPAFGPYSSKEILAETSRRIMTRRPDVETPSRIMGSYHEKMLADTDITNLFGLTGEDETVRKPAGELIGVPGYDVYKEAVRDMPVEDYETGVGTAIGLGAGFKAAGMIGKKLLGRAAITSLLPLPGSRPLAAGIALTGAALLMIPEAKAFDWVHNAIAKTDWARAREEQWWKTVGADLLVGGAVIGGPSIVAKKLRNLAKAGIKTGKAFEELKLLPDAQKLIEWKKSVDAETLANVRFSAEATKYDRGIKKEIYKQLEAPVAEAPTPWAKGGWPKALEGQPEGLIAPRGTPKTGPRKPGGKLWIDTFADFDDEMTEVALNLSKRKGIQKATQEVAEWESLRDRGIILEKAKAENITKAKATEIADPLFGTEEFVKPVKAKIPKAKKEAFRLQWLKGRHKTLIEEDRIIGRRKTEGEILADIKGAVEEVGGYRAAKPLTKKETAEFTKILKSEKAAYSELKERSGSVFKEGTEPVEDAMDNLVRENATDVDKLFRNIALIGVGLAGAMATFLAGEGTAEAGVERPLYQVGKEFTKAMGKEVRQRLYGGVTKVGKAEVEAYGKKVEKELLAGGHVSLPPTEKNPYGFTAGKHISLSKLAVKDLGNIEATIERVKPLVIGAERLLSPHTFEQIFLKTGYGPGLELGMMMSLFHSNTEFAMQAVSNIFKELPQLVRQNARKEIIAAMEPLAKSKLMNQVTLAGGVESKLIQIRKILERNKKLADQAPLTEKGFRVLQPARRKKLRDAIRIAEKAETKIAELEVTAKELAPKVAEFRAEHERLMKGLAPKYSSVRVSLAAEDTADFIHRPWLKKMLTPEEKMAVTRIKDFHNTYAERMKAVGSDTIEHRPFVHHAFHPAWDRKGIEKAMKVLDTSVSDVFPYTKFHRRTLFSEQMVPDIVHNMQRYIPDAERRIGWKHFWGKGKKGSWWDLAGSNTVRSSTPLTEFFQRLKDSSVPHPMTTGNKLANTYSALEVMRLLAFSPSVPFKHVFKLIGTASTLGIREAGSQAIDSAITAHRLWKNSPGVRRVYSKFGVKGGGRKKLLDDVRYSYLHQGRLLNNIADMEIGYTVAPGYTGKLDNILNRINKPGSVPIRAIEAWDRTISFNAAMEMAAKRGMTAQQATFGIYSTVLKNNFLSGPLNPAWMQHPKIRALFLFQNTAFKIMERRLVTAAKTGRAVKLAWKDGKTVIKNEGIGEALKQLADVRRFVKSGEHEFKRNLIADALGSQRDFNGNSIVRQFMRETLLAGSIISGGAYLGVDFMPHTAHVPFLVHGRGDPTLAISPAAKASIKTFEDWKDEDAEDRDFIVSAFLKNWLGSTKGIPNVVNKTLRISDKDIPAIYEEGKFPPWLKYLFSVPGRE